MKSDVCIVGAGPAGLTAAISAVQSGAQTVIVEANAVAGRKLLRSGRGRCNLTHTGTVKDFVKAYGRFGEFLRHSLSQFTPQHVRQYFARQNLQTKVEKDGCVFPITDRATDVKRVLVTHARGLDVRFLYGKKAKAVEKTSHGFVTTAGEQKIYSHSVIIATGGVTWPFTGSTGDGYKFAGALGHGISQPRACLVPLVTVENSPAELARSRRVGVENVRIKATVNGKRITVAGPIVFTEDGISGPAAFDLSRLLADFLPSPADPIKITVDVMPQFQLKDLNSQIISLCSKNPKTELAGVLARLLPRPLMLNLCQRLQPSGQILAGQLNITKRRQLINMLKKMPLSIKSTHPIAEATVTRGGVCTDQIDPKTMQSKLCAGLFFAGEVINADGPSGGYNLQICFSTGALAGQSAAKFAAKMSKAP